MITIHAPDRQRPKYIQASIEENQSIWVPRSSSSWREARATPINAKPVKSNGLRLVSLCGTENTSIATATTPIGKLMKKIQRQSATSVNHPPRIGPRIGPRTIAMPQIAIIWPWRLGLVTSSISAWEIGSINAPATPWIARNATISARFCARPHKAEATMKPMVDIISSRRAPIRLPSQPVIGSATAEAIM